MEITFAQPHLLIGLDLMTRIQYRHGPRLQDDIFSVHTRLGVAIGSCPNASHVSYGSWELPATFPAHNAGGRRSSYLSPDAKNLSTYSDYTIADPDTDARLEPSTSTSTLSGQFSPLTRVSGATPKSERKQISSIPLDTQPLLLPTYTTNHLE
ncbi:hypothetical protein AAVH_23031, partial [Aphelenchoides avenae]